jgi:alpha-galactosidase
MVTMRVIRPLTLALMTGYCPAAVQAIDNGVGVTPPMGWRHWKAFGAHISQDIMESMMEEMATKYPVDGVPTSLKDLGYLYVGL